MTNAQLKSLFISIETDYEKIWSTLLSFRTAEKSLTFLTLQPLLASAMLKLSNAIRAIAQQRRNCIRRKNNLSPKWFRNEMRRLARQEDLLRSAIALGKVFGDAFAWYFYQNDRDLLDKHRSHELLDISPGGIGGQGELELISQVPSFGNAFVLFHGITSMLRIGDVSFIDLSKIRVCGLGELKTARIDDTQGELQLSVIMEREFIASVERAIGKRKKYGERKTAIDLPQRQKARLKRQISSMENAVEPVANKKHLTLDQDDKGNTKLFRQMVSDAMANGYAYQKFGDGLLHIAKRFPPRRLYKSMPPVKPDIKTWFPDIEKHVLSLCHSDQELNSLHVAPFLFNKRDKTVYVPGVIPLFWWPLPPDLLRAIIFGEIVITTIFNPAHLVDKLQKNGFTVEFDRTDRNREVIKVCYKDEKGRLEFEGFHHHIEMICTSLFTEDDVVTMTLQLTELIRHDARTKRAIYPIQLNQRWAN